MDFNYSNSDFIDNYAYINHILYFFDSLTPIVAHNNYLNIISYLSLMQNEQLKKILLSGDVFTDILGQKEVKKHLKTALLTNRHVILIGTPGIGKTTLAKSVAKILPKVKVNDCSFNCMPGNILCPVCASGNIKTVEKDNIFVRIQGSPDLTVEDLIGDIDPIKALKYGPLSIEAFTPGKIFKANHGILFFDEVNRCPEKLLNSLLQVLEEGKATISNYTVDLPASFLFIGTMNPEDTSTERLSDVFLDRFDVIYMDYPESTEIEMEIVRRYAEFPENLLRVAVSFVRILRDSKDLEKKPSVRASIGLVERAGANALVNNRKPSIKDIEEVMISVLSHRIRLKPSIRYTQSTVNFLKQKFQEFCESFDELPEKAGSL